MSGNLSGFLCRLFLAAACAWPWVVLAETCDAPELKHDALNCGTCGNSCYSETENADWVCNLGSCEFVGCRAGYFDLDGDGSCEYACEFRSDSEACNGIDDDCDGFVDEDPVTPDVRETCGVSYSATASECTTEVVLSCEQGQWSCNFPDGVCPGGCDGGDEICDGFDNDCDGLVNENVIGWGLACGSDDGLPFPGHGRCAQAGTLACDGPDSLACSAGAADCATLPGGCEELCDGIDNDCDGLIDEPFSDPGPNADYFVRPETTQVGASLWVYTYEASRPDASDSSAGYGNGYDCASGCGALPPAPAGMPLEKTVACSAAGRLPWIEVTPVEAEQACAARGGHLCELAEYQDACEAASGCDWAYSPAGVDCTSSHTGSKFCNLSVSFDFDVAAGRQQGLLDTASSRLENCWADWSGQYPGNDQVFDLTGNLREFAKFGSGAYALMGGSFLTEVEAGAGCNFDFMAADGKYATRDTGFRCCFDQDPSP